MNPLRIVLDGRVINDHFPGIGRYTYRLADALARSGAIDLTLIVHPARPNTHYPIEALAAAHGTRLHVLPIDIAPLSLSEQTRMPAFARQLHPDVWHAPYYIMPYRRVGCPTVVTFYDTIPLSLPQFWSPRQRLIFRITHQLALRVADRAIAISEATQRDLLRHFDVHPSRIAVTPLAADEHFRPQSPDAIARVRQRYGLPPGYLLYFGINKPPKNLRRLVRAYATALSRLPASESPAYYPELVIAGAWDDRYPQARQVAAASPFADRIRFIGAVAEDDLPALYAGADWFVSATLYEGFGLPALEALACGTPVVCSRTSSMPEVVGDAAVLFNPRQVETIADALQRAMSKPTLREEMRERGLARAAQFSWERTAEATIAVYQSIRSKDAT
jgi:alpha-1,3-rhamnosyl/mannosyltransferase